VVEKKGGVEGQCPNGVCLNRRVRGSVACAVTKGQGHSHCLAILVHLQFGDLHVARVNANVNGGACGEAYE
jgi:hypothetical protein